MYDDQNIINLKPGLYCVATPIGNLGDITIRALEVIKNSDIILCEDTRVSKKLLNKFKIHNKLISNHKFNENKNLNFILEHLENNKIISIISDAGTPAISDPGRVLINKCIERKINIYSVPGPSAVSAAISISGFSDKYLFFGFLPEKKTELNRLFNSVSNINNSIVFFISPKKINKIIPEIKKNFSGRKIVFCREISKVYEEFIRQNVDDLKPFAKQPKGELTIVVSEKKIDKFVSHELTESDKNIIKKIIDLLSIKEIVTLINENNNVSKKQIYNYCLSLKNEN